MKKTVVFGVTLVLLILGSAFQVHAEDPFPFNLSPLKNDFTTLFTGIGREVVPFLQQTAVSGNIVGEAGFGTARVSLSFPVVSITGSQGIGTFIDSEDWEFELLSLPDLITDAVGTDNEFYNASKDIFAYPSLRFGLGVRLFGGFEVLLNGFYLPTFLLDTVVNLAEKDKAGMLHSLGMDLGIVNIGGMLRKVVVSERKGSLRPSVSLGAGYTYASFNLGLADFRLSDLMDEPVDVPTMGVLDIYGSADIDTVVHTVGLELHASKRLLIFTPFAKLGAWYHHSAFTTETSMDASITPEGQTATSTDFSFKAEESQSDVSVLFTAGCELKLFVLILSPSITINLQDPEIAFHGFSLDDLKMKGVTVNLGTRLQF